MNTLGSVPLAFTSPSCTWTVCPWCFSTHTGSWSIWITDSLGLSPWKPKLSVIHMDQDPECVEKHQGQTVHVQDGEVNANGTLPNVFVYVKEGADKYTFP